MSMKAAALTAVAVGALVAVPAVASATTVYPAGHSFEVYSPPGFGFSTSFGTCGFAKMTGSVPAAPNNVAAGLGPVSLPVAPVAGACTPGSLTAGAGWTIEARARFTSDVTIPANAATLRYTSLPGCKLVNASKASIAGFWNNGFTSPSLMPTVYTLNGSYVGTWANDGGACAIAGTTEAVTVTTSVSGVLEGLLTYDKTNAANVIQIGL